MGRGAGRYRAGVRAVLGLGIVKDGQAMYQDVVEDEERGFRVAPGLVVAVLAVLLVGAIVVGVLTQREAGPSITRMTVADLRADPERWDGQTVDLVGTVEGIRELPVLSQYALYTFRDETGTLQVLSQKGAPPSGAGSEEMRVRGVFHSRVQLDAALKRLVEEQLGPLGPLAGSAVAALVPGIPLNVVYLEHESYEVGGGT